MRAAPCVCTIPGALRRAAYRIPGAAVSPPVPAAPSRGGCGAAGWRGGAGATRPGEAAPVPSPGLCPAQPPPNPRSRYGAAGLSPEQIHRRVRPCPATAGVERGSHPTRRTPQPNRPPPRMLWGRQGLAPQGSSFEPRVSPSGFGSTKVSCDDQGCRAALDLCRSAPAQQQQPGGTSGSREHPLPTGAGSAPHGVCKFSTFWGSFHPLFPGNAVDWSAGPCPKPGFPVDIFFAQLLANQFGLGFFWFCGFLVWLFFFFFFSPLKCILISHDAEMQRSYLHLPQFCSSPVVPANCVYTQRLVQRVAFGIQKIFNLENGKKPKMMTSLFICAASAANCCILVAFFAIY